MGPSIVLQYALTLIINALSTDQNNNEASMFNLNLDVGSLPLPSNPAEAAAGPHMSQNELYLYAYVTLKGLMQGLTEKLMERLNDGRLVITGNILQSYLPLVSQGFSDGTIQLVDDEGVYVPVPQSVIDVVLQHVQVEAGNKVVTLSPTMSTMVEDRQECVGLDDLPVRTLRQLHGGGGGAAPQFDQPGGERQPGMATG